MSIPIVAGPAGTSLEMASWLGVKRFMKLFAAFVISGTMIYGSITQGQVKDIVAEEMEIMYRNVESESDMSHQPMMDNIQKQFTCCGLSGSDFFRNERLWGWGKIPSSCCKENVANCTAELAQERRGCMGVCENRKRHYTRRGPVHTTTNLPVVKKVLEKL